MSRWIFTAAFMSRAGQSLCRETHFPRRKLIVTLMTLLSVLTAVLLIPYLIYALCRPERF